MPDPVHLTITDQYGRESRACLREMSRATTSPSAVTCEECLRWMHVASVRA